MIVGVIGVGKCWVWPRLFVFTTQLCASMQHGSIDLTGRFQDKDATLENAAEAMP